MKRIILIIALLIFTSTQVFAQRRGGDKIKALKTAFITNALDLSSKEAQDFWPIYNEYDKIVHQEKKLKTRQLNKKVRENGGFDSLSDAEANKLLQEFINIDIKVANAKNELIKDLKGVIPPKKILKLFKAEQDFNKELLKRLRDRRQQNIKNRN